jgi:thioredoxin 1
MAVNKVTSTDFDSQVLQGSTPVLVDFYADWCGPCKLAEPVLDELSESYKDKVKIVKLNVDEENALAGKYGVMSIPTTILFRNGQEVDRQIGFGGKQTFENLIKKGIGGDSNG